MLYGVGKIRWPNRQFDSSCRDARYGKNLIDDHRHPLNRIDETLDEGYSLRTALFHLPYHGRILQQPTVTVDQGERRSQFVRRQLNKIVLDLVQATQFGVV